MKRVIFYPLVLGVMPLTAFSNTLAERDPSQIEVKATSVVDSADVKLGALRQQAISTGQQEKEGYVLQYTGTQLVESPEILEDLFLKALVTPNKDILPIYVKLYKLVPTKDQSLIDWANAILLREQDLDESVGAYRNLLTNFPDNNYIRYQLAETLFYNQEYEAAKSQFEKLRSVSGLSDQDRIVFDGYIEAINGKEDWNFAFGATFLNDKNLGNSAKPGTKIVFPNGSSVTYNSERQKGQGISAWLSADKQWRLSGKKYLAFKSSLSSKYYWNNKSYNDVNASVGLGIGYADARFNIEFTPNISKRWYAGGLNSGKALKQYSDTYGADLSLSYWLSQKFKYSFNYNYGYDMYNKVSNDNQYRGASHGVVNAILYIPKPTQYWSLALDLNKKYAQDKTNAYNRIGSRLTWGQEWPYGFSTSTTLGIAKRNYRGMTFFGSKQKNTEYSAGVSLWHKDVHFMGLTPRITFNYTKIDSNIPIYSYDKSQILLDVSKSF